MYNATQASQSQGGPTAEESKAGQSQTGPKDDGEVTDVDFEEVK
jgi:hypothetical protein